MNIMLREICKFKITIPVCLLLYLQLDTYLAVLILDAALN